MSDQQVDGPVVIPVVNGGIDRTEIIKRFNEAIESLHTQGFYHLSFLQSFCLWDGMVLSWVRWRLNRLDHGLSETLTKEITEGFRGRDHLFKVLFKLASRSDKTLYRLLGEKDPQNYQEFRKKELVKLRNTLVHDSAQIPHEGEQEKCRDGSVVIRHLLNATSSVFQEFKVGSSWYDGIGAVPKEIRFRGKRIF